MAAESAEVIANGKAALKAVLKYHTEQQVRAADERRRVENEAAAQKLADLKAVSKKNTAKRDAAEEAERQRLREGLQIDKEDQAGWRKEYDAMGIAGMK